ncbi:hypothetical protein Tco_1203335 [Tanacetum coccineum]
MQDIWYNRELIRSKSNTIMRVDSERIKMQCSPLTEASSLREGNIKRDVMLQNKYVSYVSKKQKSAIVEPTQTVPSNKGNQLLLTRGPATILFFKTNLDETSRALGEATSCRDSCLIALQNKQNELEKYIAFNGRTIDYDILQTKLNETLGLLARKDIDIKEGLKTKAYEISVVNQKHDELVKRSLLTKSQFEGQLKEKSKVISDLKVKEEKDIDKMIEIDKQLMFLNETVYTRNQSIQTVC